MTFINSTSSTFNVSVHNTLGSAVSVPFGSFRRALLHVPTGASSATVTFYASGSESGTFQQIYDSSGSAVSLAVVADRSYDLPAAVEAAEWLKIVTSTALGLFLGQHPRPTLS